MGFSSGTISFRRFAVVGPAPASVDQDLLDRLAEHAFRERDVGVPDEAEYGWSGGRHVLDASFSFENNVFNDALLFGLRVDTNRVPGELKKAYQFVEEESAAKQNPSGFISKLQKRDANDVVRRRVDEDLRSGRFRRSKLTPILWDLPSQTLLCNVASGPTQEKLLEIFERTFDLKLMPLSAGAVALRLLEPKGRRRDYEDARPTRFVRSAESESEHPEYPWVMKGPEPKDFLGNEFALWLWHQTESRGDALNGTTAMFDRFLDLDCAFGQTGRDLLRCDGVARMPEASDGLKSGKVPRRASLILEAGGQQFSFTLGAEGFAIGSLKLPDVEEADNPRVVFEERVGMLRDFCRAVDGLFEKFLKTRTSSAWEGQTNTIRKWIQQSRHAHNSAAELAIA
jgi:hypothetical protein